jgi:hypothetical protein
MFSYRIEITFFSCRETLWTWVLCASCDPQPTRDHLADLVIVANSIFGNQLLDLRQHAVDWL